ncbi:MAG: hypothetical protein AAF270_17010, partial [Pseudomonadota bacterium]
MHLFLQCRTAAPAIIVTALIALGSWALPGHAIAQGSQLTIPGEAPTGKVKRAQVKAEEAYERGDYSRAFWLYRTKLVPVGDKYAQYMVGYMLQHGQGTTRDEVEAAAWFSLAAERGHKPIVELVEEYKTSLSEEQVLAAKARSLELKAEIGDRALVERLIRRDMRRLREMTGTRLRRATCGGRPGRVVSGAGNLTMTEYCTALNERIDRRLEYISGYVTYGELELLPDE